MPDFVIPKRIKAYLKRLELSYLHDNDNARLEVVRNAYITIDEGTDSHADWGDVSYGHGFTLFLPSESLQKVGNISAQKEMAKAVLDDLRQCAESVRNEHIVSLDIDLFDQENPECANAVSPLGAPTLAPEGLGIWKHGYIRVFVSHKAEYKEEVGALKAGLQKYGIDCFVTHDTIEPLEEWEDQIRKSLFSMEILLTFITDNFSESNWTDQEIGVAIGRGIPIIPLKMQRKDPYGFIGRYQALRGNLENIEGTIDLVHKTIAEKIDREGRLKTAAIEAFANSTNYDDARDTFDVLSKYEEFNDDEINRIVAGYNFNNQLYGAAYLNNQNQRFKKFLEKKSERQFSFVNGEVREVNLDLDDEIPF